MRMMGIGLGIMMGLLLLAAPLDPATAQSAPDTLRLEEVRRAAALTDPRSVQPELLARAARHRIGAIRLGALPQFGIGGEATWQSDVPQLGAGLPVDLTIPKEQYRIEANAEWSIYDGGMRGRQAAAERARLAEQEAGVEASLYPVREAATETFFGILLMQAQHETLLLAAENLESRLQVVRVRAREGAALEADAAVLEAEVIRLGQQAEEVAADLRAARAVLADLTGLAITAETPLASPDLAAPFEAVIPAGRSAEARPELERIDLQAERIRAEARSIEARLRPTISLFGRGGVGRPSPLDFLSDEVQPYAIGGVRLRWAAFDWGRTRREAAAMRLQADLLETEREALGRRFSRDVEADLEDVSRLESALAQDNRMVQLREDAAFVAQRQLDEGVLLPDAYRTRVTDLAEARLMQERHRIELARARARVLSALGRFPESTTASNPAR